jgi:hypothetical protein
LPNIGQSAVISFYTFLRVVVFVRPLDAFVATEDVAAPPAFVSGLDVLDIPFCTGGLLSGLDVLDIFGSSGLDVLIICFAIVFSSLSHQLIRFFQFHFIPRFPPSSFHPPA